MLVYKLKNSNILSNDNISFFKILDKKFFFIDKYKTYFVFPEYVFLKKADNSLFFIFPNLLEQQAFFFLSYFLNFFKKLIKLSRKKLTLVGLGFRIVLTEDGYLSFKLGFSHLINIKVPNNIRVVVIKNNLYLEGPNPEALGNFVSVIKNLKYPDQYKGKGFWFRSDKKKLKPVKKT